MKKMVILSSLFIFPFFYSNLNAQSCESKIEGTKWYYRWASDTLIFTVFRNDKRFISAEEDGNIYYGHYTCSGDTITTIEDGCKYEYNKKNFKKSIFVCILKNNSLIPVYSKYDDIPAFTNFDTSAIMYMDSTYLMKKRIRKK